MSLLACAADADPKPGSCEATAKAMGKVTKLGAWKPPADCTAKGIVLAPRSLTKEADARDHVACKDPKAKLGVDFAKRQLIVTSRTASPAEAGIDGYDDGKKITFVSRQRIPCRTDPRPMPGPNQTFLYEAGAGARTFADASCNVEPKCP